jgi:hypothetical protein
MLLDLKNQNLTTLVGMSFPSNIDELILDNNNLSSLQGLPDGLVKLHVNNNNSLTSLQYAPDTVTEICANNCAITSSTTVPAALVYLSLNFNDLTSLSFLSSCYALITLYVNNNKITSLLDCPSTVTFLYISNNSLTNLLYLPLSVVYLDISNNAVTALTDFTDDHITQTLNISNTSVTSLTGIPPTCQFIRTYNNNISGIYLDPPAQVLEIRQVTENTTHLKNVTILFPIQESGLSIRNTTMTRLTSIIYPGTIISVGNITFNLEMNSGTVTLKLVQINKKTKLGKTLFTTSVTSSNSIYDIPLPNILNVQSTLELQGYASSKYTGAILYSCMLY